MNGPKWNEEVDFIGKNRKNSSTRCPAVVPAGVRMDRKEGPELVEISFLK